MDKKIDWVGTLGMITAYLIGCNGLILLIWNVFDDSSKFVFANMETHIIFSLGYILLKIGRGHLITYEGWLEDESDGWDSYFKPEKNIRYLIFGIVALLVVYLYMN